jgi:hypothetical protein
VALGSGVELGSEVAVKAGAVAEGDGEAVSVNSGDGMTETVTRAQALNANPRKMSRRGLAYMVIRYTPHLKLTGFEVEQQGTGLRIGCLFLRPGFGLQPVRRARSQSP